MGKSTQKDITPVLGKISPKLQAALFPPNSAWKQTSKGSFSKVTSVQHTTKLKNTNKNTKTSYTLEAKFTMSRIQ